VHPWTDRAVARIGSWRSVGAVQRRGRGHLFAGLWWCCRWTRRGQSPL